MGKYQARLAADHILGYEHAISHGADGPLAPHVIFTDPQVAAVGHTTETATRAGLDFDADDTETPGNLGGTIYDRNAPGTARFLVDRERRILIGCTITGSDVADFLHAATIAVVGELPLERLRHAVPRSRPVARSGSRCSSRRASDPVGGVRARKAPLRRRNEAPGKL